MNNPQTTPLERIADDAWPLIYRATQKADGASAYRYLEQALQAAYSEGVRATIKMQESKTTEPCGCQGEWLGHNWRATVCAKHVVQPGEDYCKAHLRGSWVKSIQLQQ